MAKKTLKEQFADVLRPGLVNFKTFVWEIEGLTPLLMNNPLEAIVGSDNGASEEPAPKSEEKKKGDRRKKTEEIAPDAFSGKPKYDDVNECEIRLYRTDDGEFYIPSVGFRNCMTTGVSHLKLGQTSARTAIAKTVFPAEAECIVMDSELKNPLTTYTIDRRPVRIGTALVKRCRPRFDNWGCYLALEINVTDIAIETVTTALNLGGAIIGVMDGRPDPSKGKKGTLSFGRFRARLKE